MGIAAGAHDAREGRRCLAGRGVNVGMRPIYLPSNASKARLRDAERARANRTEIVRELSWGRVSRRDLVKWGLFTGAGLLAPISGLSPFVSEASAAVGPTGAPPSPLFGALPFSQPMPRFDVLARKAVSTLTPAPTAYSNQTPQAVDPQLGGGTGPIEGRPPGAVWAHQAFSAYPPAIAIETSSSGVLRNHSYNPQVPNGFNSGIDRDLDFTAQFHPSLPVQAKNSLWTFDGTLPPKLVKARYGEPILFRHHMNCRPTTRNRGSAATRCRRTSTTRHAPRTRFTGAFFFPNHTTTTTGRSCSPG